MSESSSAGKMSVSAMISRFLILLAAAGIVGFGGTKIGMDSNQAIACAVFISIIFGTLFFWGFRLAVAFLGLAVLIFNKSLDIPTFVSSSSLEVIMGSRFLYLDRAVDRFHAQSECEKVYFRNCHCQCASGVCGG